MCFVFLHAKNRQSMKEVKENNDSWFLQFSERFCLETALCACKNRQCRVKDILLTDTIMFEKKKKSARGPFSKLNEEQIFITGFVLCSILK